MLLKMYTQIGAALCLLPRHPSALLGKRWSSLPLCPSSWQKRFPPSSPTAANPGTSTLCAGRAKVLFQLFIVEAGAREFVLMEFPLYLFLGDNLGLIFFPYWRSDSKTPQGREWFHCSGSQLNLHTRSHHTQKQVISRTRDPIGGNPIFSTNTTKDLNHSGI